MKQDNQSHKQLASSNSESDTSSSEEDENAELLTDEVEERFFKVLSRLKKKDSTLYEGNEKFFPVEEETESDLMQGKKEKMSQEEYREWLKGQKVKVENKKVKEELKALHKFWTNPSINKEEQFLRDYILNKKFLDPDDNFNIEEEINKLSDEEKEVEEQLLFEHKYNTRFENPDQQPESRVKPKKSKKLRKGISTFGNNDEELEQTLSNKGSVEKEQHVENKKRKMEQISAKKEVVEVKKLKLTNNLPRSVQLKNLKSIKKRKMRHRNRKKENIANGVGEQKDRKIQDNRVGFDHKKLGKKIVHSENVDTYDSGAKCRKIHKNKGNKHSKNLIVKEKKNKMFKFGKMVSKKQKASNANS